MFWDNLRNTALFITLLPILFITRALFSGLVGYCQSDRTQELEDKILRLAKENSPQLYDALDEIDRLPSDQAASLLVRLVDYYLGEHASEYRSEKLTKIGEQVIPLLVKKRNGPLMCLERYKSLCTGSIED
mgnify:CR=1 FL=1